LTATFVATPTCACDGKVYNGECDANSHGADLNAHGSCYLPAAQSPCGYAVSNLANQYCQRQPHLGAAAETFSCMPLSCTGTPTCACLAQAPCGHVCTRDAKSRLP